MPTNGADQGDRGDFLGAVWKWQKQTTSIFRGWFEWLIDLRQGKSWQVIGISGQMVHQGRPRYSHRLTCHQPRYPWWSYWSPPQHPSRSWTCHWRPCRTGCLDEHFSLGTGQQQGWWSTSWFLDFGLFYLSLELLCGLLWPNSTEIASLLWFPPRIWASKILGKAETRKGSAGRPFSSAILAKDSRADCPAALSPIFATSASHHKKRMTRGSDSVWALAQGFSFWQIICLILKRCSSRAMWQKRAAEVDFGAAASISAFSSAAIAKSDWFSESSKDCAGLSGKHWEVDGIDPKKNNLQLDSIVSSGNPDTVQVWNHPNPILPKIMELRFKKKNMSCASFIFKTTRHKWILVQVDSWRPKR